MTILSAGTYRLTGTLSQGQIAVDLGDEAKDDPDAVVTLILDNVDVTCTVAPALIFTTYMSAQTAMRKLPAVMWTPQRQALT
ncbi:MAG TPA: carbohydrate-binding domain-containing protein [Candidatus Scatomorpha gallistercoris]|nr:carbohydrate-binding domain-containing protein [Candidatus Scatomorpha gallistercoris]